MKLLHQIAFVLVIIGGLNWLCQALFGWEVGMFLGGMTSMLSRVVYILVGLSAIWLIFNHKNECKWCMSGTGAPRS